MSPTVRVRMRGDEQFCVSNSSGGYMQVRSSTHFHNASKGRNIRTGTWDDERVKLLKRLWNEGNSCSVIATILGGISRNAVIGKIHRLGLSGRSTVQRLKPRPRRRQRVNPAIKYRLHQSVHKQSRKSIFEALPKEPLPDPAITDVARISLDNLEPHHCRWPISAHANAVAHGYCGCQSVPGLPYCQDHARRAFRAPEVHKKHSKIVPLYRLAPRVLPHEREEVLA